MRVVFLEDVSGVALGGDVREVKNGFARNYLIPQKLAVPAGREALKQVDHLGRKAEVQRLKMLADSRELGKELDGTRVNVDMRAGASGRLYGSVTGAIVAAELSRLTDREIDRRTVALTEPIRQVGRYDVHVRLHSEVDATISLLVYPTGADPDETLAEITVKEEAEAAEAEANREAEAAEAEANREAEAAEAEAAQEAQGPTEGTGPSEADQPASDAGEEAPEG